VKRGHSAIEFPQLVDIVGIGQAARGVNKPDRTETCCDFDF